MKALKSWQVLVAGLLLLSLPVRSSAQTVARLLVLPVQLRLEVGATGQITVEVQDASSQSIGRDVVPVAFTSADTTIATVSADGAVQGWRAGRTQITVKAAARVQVVQVSVSGGAAPVRPAAAAPGRPAGGTTAPAAGTPAASPFGPQPVGVTIVPTSIQILQGERVRPVLRLIMPDGSQIEARDVTWSVYGQALALDPVTNEVVGVVPGGGTLNGRHGSGLSSATPVTVAEAAIVTDRDSLVVTVGATDSVAVVVPTQGRRRVTQNLAWRSTEPSVVRVLNPTIGVFQAGTPGTATLILDAYGVTRTVQVRVLPRLARIETSVPGGASIVVGATASIRLDAKPVATDGSVLPAQLLTWRIADTTIARIDTTGRITGIREGTTLVTLDVPGVERTSWPLSVARTRATFAQNVSAIFAGTTRTFTATLRSPDQRDFGPAASPQFRSLTTEVATIDGSGMVTAVAPGRAEIVVMQDGAGADTATVFVTGRTLVSGSMSGVTGLWQLVSDADSVPVLLARVDSGQVSQAVWSPDRTQIAATFEPRDRTGQARVVVLDADGRNWTVLSPDSLSASDPAWTADGSAVLMSAMTAKTSSVLRIGTRARDQAVLISSTTTRLRYPIPETDTAAVLVRLEADNQVDIARVRSGAATMLTVGKPREELLTRLPQGRVLVAVDSSAKGRAFTALSVVAGSEQLQAPVAMRLPPGLFLTDISAGNDDASVIVVGRTKSWPGATGAAVVVLRLPVDGSSPKVLLLLNEKDAVTVRTP